MHHEALQHFYEDPRNGLSRLPVVYEKVVKEWKTPWFSPGELDQEKPIPDEKVLINIHSASLKDFTDPGPLPKEIPFRFNFKGDRNKPPPAVKHWEAKNVDLVGLLLHPEPVVYPSEKIPEGKKAHGETAETRPLDGFEVMGLDALNNGKDLFALERDGVVRMLGAVRANKTCLKCHDDKKDGDLLGAFSYTVREAEYKRVTRFPSGSFRPDNPPKSTPPPAKN
jgi:hypothetical protein